MAEGERVARRTFLGALEGAYGPSCATTKARPAAYRACLDALAGQEFAPDPLGAGPRVRSPDVSALLQRVRELHGL